MHSQPELLLLPVLPTFCQIQKHTLPRCVETLPILFAFLLWTTWWPLKFHCQTTSTIRPRLSLYPGPNGQVRLVRVHCLNSFESLSFVPHIAHYRNGDYDCCPECNLSDDTVALFEFVDVNTPGLLKTLPEVFDNGYQQGPDVKLLGHRPVISIQPLKFGSYVWQTYRQVDVRRRKIGSALHELFRSGVLKAEDLQTVGIWAQNRPGRW